MDSHLVSLCNTREIARQRLQKAVTKRKEVCDEQNRSVSLKTGDKIRNRRHYTGMAKLQGMWTSDIYTVIKIP